MGEYDLHHHGDREVGPGLVDLAVNVRLPRPPEWLRRELASALDTLAAYPDSTAAAEAVAGRHGRAVAEVLATAGAAEAFTLLASALRPEHAVVVHPQFTEPEAALRAAGHEVSRVVLSTSDGFTLRPEQVPASADLVYVGNPTNPTSVLHPASTLRALTRPGRLLVVDEAFLDAVPGEAESLAGEPLPGVAVLRSLTKTWGLAGLRAGYLLGPPDVVARLRAVQPPWSVSTLAGVATVVCCRPAAVEEAEKLAVAAESDREYLVSGLAALGFTTPGLATPGLAALGLATPGPTALGLALGLTTPGPTALGPAVLGDPRGPFVLVCHPDPSLRARLRDAGYAVRRGDTFPGLGPEHFRLAVRSPEVTDGFLTALARLL